MKETPLLMCAEMVRAVLDGRKWQTRRIVKLPLRCRTTGCELTPLELNEREVNSVDTLCLQGGPGDHLWVKEAWRTDKEYDKFAPSQIDSGASLFFVADQKALRVNHRAEYGRHEWGKTRSSIFMPRWVSRITLEIVSVRVERVQEITGGAILSEGACPPQIVGGERASLLKDYWIPLWDSLNAKRGYGWDKNPWVWVIEFKKP